MKTKVPFILSLLCMIGGVLIAIFFGINEQIFKGKIARDIVKNEKIMKIENLEKRQSKIETEKAKNWRYYQRFHFHATGIGTMSLVTLILLSFSLAPAVLKTVSAYMISFGGFCYPFIWLFAGIYGPVIGRYEAKEAFAVFGYMGGVLLLGLMLSVYIIIKYPNKLFQD